MQWLLQETYKRRSYKCVSSQKTEMRCVFTGSPESIPSKYVHCDSHELCLAWAHHLFSSEEAFSITSTSVDLISLMLYQRLSGVCM